MASPLKWRLDGQTALVTGGTKGIGRSTAEELLSLGARVFICARSAEDVERTLSEWRGKGMEVSGRACDVVDAQQRKELIEAVSREFGGRLNHLVNNVGSNIRKPTVDFSAEEFSKVFSINLESAFSLSQLAHPLLCAAVKEAPPSIGESTAAAASSTSGANERKGNASIVFDSSVAGIVAIRSGSLYAMTKAAMNHLTRYLACEWAKDGIRVNAVAPWYTHTDLANQVLQDPEFKADVVSRTPLRRCANPDEVASAIAFFCLRAASYVSGQILAVDGGFTVSAFFPLQD